MRFWFSRVGDVPIREQIVTQVILGVVAGDLPEGQRLPSTRELAQRYHLHPNTISAAYCELERQGWVESRRGSGVYARRQPQTYSSDTTSAIDLRIGELFRQAREIGVPLSDLRARLEHWLAVRQPDHFLIIESDEELQRILQAEMQNATRLPVRTISLAGFRRGGVEDGAIFSCLPSRAAEIRQQLAPGSELMVLQVRSVPRSLEPWANGTRDVVVSIASRWPGFLKWARTMLVAAGFHPDSLVLCDARRPGWLAPSANTLAVVTLAKVPHPCTSTSIPRHRLVCRRHIMKQLAMFVLLLLLAVPAWTLDEPGSTYLGGSVISLKPGATGQFNLTQESTFIFEGPAGRLAVPYASITTYCHRSELKHRLGVLPTIAVGLVAARKRRNFMQLEFRDAAGVPQAALFEVTRDTWNVLQPVLNARVPKPKKLEQLPSQKP